MGINVSRPMDEQWPSIMEHFDQQFASAQADMRVVRAAQETLAQQINAVNARIETVTHEVGFVKERQAEVLAEVRKTNGRVNKLEIDGARSEAFLSGAQKTAGGSLNIAFSLVMAAVAMGSLIVAVISTR